MDQYFTQTDSRTCYLLKRRLSQPFVTGHRTGRRKTTYRPAHAPPQGGRRPPTTLLTTVLGLFSDAKSSYLFISYKCRGHCRELNDTWGEILSADKEISPGHFQLSWAFPCSVLRMKRKVQGQSSLK
jgi:hypothetical protein